MANALDRFFADPLNRPLAIYIVVQQATGVDRKEINKTVHQLRRGAC